MNSDCVWFYEEADVNWRECRCPALEDEWAEGARTDCEDCGHYYTKEDAKADSRESMRDFRRENELRMLSLWNDI
jgi:hypothetical protein